MILVTGATGSNGSELTKLLAARGVPVRAMVRSREGAKAVAALPGVELALGDFDDAASVEHALQGVEKAFLLTNSTERAEARQFAFVDAARRGGMKHVVKLSQFAADENSPVRFLRYHAAVERAIVESGMAYTFLRLLAAEPLHAGAARVPRAHRVAGPVLRGRRRREGQRRGRARQRRRGRRGADRARPRRPDLRPHRAGSADARRDGASLSDAVGRPIAFVDVPPEAMRSALLGAGRPPWQADGLIEDYAHYRRGEASAVAPGVRDATGGAPPGSRPALRRGSIAATQPEFPPWPSR